VGRKALVPSSPINLIALPLIMVGVFGANRCNPIGRIIAADFEKMHGVIFLWTNRLLTSANHNPRFINLAILLEMWVGLFL
jgi:hypothetical protein